MIEIEPINALVYNQKEVKISDVVAPSYDVIDTEYENTLRKRSPYNIVNLVLPGKNNNDKYIKANRLFKKWQQRAIVSCDNLSIFYIIQKYTDEKGRLVERKGFIARVRIEDFSKKNILPHENTMEEPIRDRFNLVSATNAFFSPIFMIYKDLERKIESSVFEKYSSDSPFIDVTDDFGVKNTVYIIDNNDDINQIREILKYKTILIADGHHRYEAAKSYSESNPNNEYAKYVMSYFTNAADENLTIYPTHRIVEKDIPTREILKKVSKYYDIKTVNDKELFLKKIEEKSKKQNTMGLILREDSNYYILTQKKEKLINTSEILKNLDLEILHETILKNELGFSDCELKSQNGVKYERREDIAFESVKKGASACFIMAYPKIDDIISISVNGGRMPQKSTYFYPKLLSGLVINPLERSVK